MSPKVVAFSTRTGILYAQPYGLHFWECPAADFDRMRTDPRSWLKMQGIDLPSDVRIAMTVEDGGDNDFSAFDAADVICNVGGWRAADGERVFRIVSSVPDEQGAEWFRGSVLPRSTGSLQAA